jgi:glycosyltransferase involved in cell wall biosynthesis
MKISIITVTFNSSKTLKTTLESVASQTFKNIEHIIVDGQSSDNTLMLLKNYPHIHKVISEKDNGIYDAMNKGINNASGDVIGFLNSDDWFYNSKIIEEIANAFDKNDVDAVYGDLVFVKNENDFNPKRVWVSGPYKSKYFLSGWVPPHPTFYAKTNVYKKYGLFNSNLIFAADFDIMCRFIAKENIKTKYLPGYKVKMRLGGATTKNLTNILKGNIEIFNSLYKNGLHPGPTFIIRKIITKLKQINIF